MSSSAIRETKVSYIEAIHSRDKDARIYKLRTYTLDQLKEIWFKKLNSNDYYDQHHIPIEKMEKPTKTSYMHAIYNRDEKSRLYKLKTLTINQLKNVWENGVDSNTVFEFKPLVSDGGERLNMRSLRNEIARIKLFVDFDENFDKERPPVNQTDSDFDVPASRQALNPADAVLVNRPQIDKER